ncbi:MAG: hypothetical protein IIB87_07880 [Chloroflexi bacterium]|nr:hypothetical protein [Chloroflexota bacterium]
MDNVRRILAALNSEEGHALPYLGVLPAAAGAVLLGIGAANDTDWMAIAGGIVLAVGVFATPILAHSNIDYDIYNRLNKLEKSE